MKKFATLSTVLALVLGFAFTGITKADSEWRYEATGTIMGWTQDKDNKEYLSSFLGIPNMIKNYEGVYQESGSQLDWGKKSVGQLTGTNWTDNHSSFSITGNSGTFAFDESGEAFISNAITFDHANKILSSDIATPTSISFTLSFAAYLGKSLVESVSLDITASFWETPNSLFGPSQDIFFFVDPFSSVTSNLMEFSFLESLDGKYYDIAAEKLGITDGSEIFGWTTKENGTVTTSVGMKIKDPNANSNAVATPEPATLLVLGLGAAGAGFLRRRQLLKK